MFGLWPRGVVHEARPEKAAGSTGLVGGLFCYAYSYASSEFNGRLPTKRRDGMVDR